FLWYHRYDIHVLHLPFFFTSAPTTETYTLSLHDALPIYLHVQHHQVRPVLPNQLHGGSAVPRLSDDLMPHPLQGLAKVQPDDRRSEEHTSELQSRGHLVCRLLLEKIKEAPGSTADTKTVR